EVVVEEIPSQHRRLLGSRGLAMSRRQSPEHPAKLAVRSTASRRAPFLRCAELEPSVPPAPECGKHSFHVSRLPGGVRRYSQARRAAGNCGRPNRLDPNPTRREMALPRERSLLASQHDGKNRALAARHLDAETREPGAELGAHRAEPNPRGVVSP